MKIKNSMLKRVLSLIMAFAMVISLVPPAPANAAAISGGTKLYLKPNANWKSNNAWFAAYFCNGSSSAEWVKMTDNDGDGIYEVTVPAGKSHKNVIFCRMNPASQTLDWSNKWNQTGDLTYDGTKSLHTIPTGNGVWDCGTDGSWSKFIPYVIAGDSAVFGTNWNTEDTNNQMSLNANSVYEKVYLDVTAGNYGFKVTDGTWDNAWPGDNYALAVNYDGSTVTITFNAKTKTVAATVYKEFAVEFNGENVTSNGVDAVKADSNYTATLTPAEGYNLPEKVSVKIGAANAVDYDVVDGKVTIPGSAVIGNINITAQGVAKTYTVTAADGIEHGSITVPATATTDETVTIEVEPDDGYELNELTYTVGSGAPVAITDNRFIMPAGNVTVHASFRLIPVTTYSVTVKDSIENGTVTVSKNPAAEGDSITLTANPAEGYKLGNWTVLWGETPIEVTDNAFTMPAGNVTVSASFTLKTYEVDIHTENVQVTGNDTATHGQPYTLTLETVTGYDLPEKVSVKIGTADAVDYEVADGRATIPGEKVTGDIVVNASGVLTTTTIYLNPRYEWYSDNARFAMYYWKSSNNADCGWVNMTDEDRDGTYEAELPYGYTNVIFTRMNPNIAENSWENNSVYNQTIDETYDGENSCFTITNPWGSDENGKKATGTWSAEVPVYTYTVAGDWEMCTNNWSPSDTNNDMTLNPNTGLYEITFQNVPANNSENTSHEFKVVENHAWTHDWGHNGQNDKVVVTYNGSTVKISFNHKTGEITKTVIDPALYTVETGVTGNGSIVCGQSQVPAGDTVTFTATATEGHALGSLSVKEKESGEAVEYTLSNGVYSFTMPAAGVQITADFKPVYKVTVNAENGTVNAAPGSAIEGTVVTLTVTPNPGYELETLTVKKGNETVDVENNQFVMPDGDVTVTASFSARNFDVTFDKENVTVTGDDKATYGQPYSAKVIVTDTTTHKLPVQVAVSVAGGESFSCDVNENGNFTVLGDKILGNLTISVKAVLLGNFDVSYADLSNITSTNTAESIKEEETYSTVLTAVQGYTLPATITVKMGGNVLTEGYSYNAETGELIINDVTGGITIIAEGVPNAYQVLTTGLINITATGEASATHGIEYTATLTPAKGYKLPETIKVEVGGVELTEGFTYLDGVVTIPAEQVTGEIVITAQAEVATMTVFFQNNWKWTDVKAYYWGSSVYNSGAFPGDAMTYVEVKDNHDVYAVQVPGDIEGILFSGVKDDGSGKRDQSPDITEIRFDDAFYYMEWADGNQVGTADYTPPAGPNQYVAKIHFVNNLNWGSVYQYGWIANGIVVTDPWQGYALAQDKNGFYSVSVSYNAYTNPGLNFIFNDGTSQTVDLKLEASAFNNNQAEVWVKPTDQNSENKYNAEIITNGESVVVSPTVSGHSVTFRYKNDSATYVEVFGSWNNWASSTKLQQNADGLWTVTLNDLAVGKHEYKFVLNQSQDGWITDPSNGWTENGNSVFQIGDPIPDTNKITIKVHYTRNDGNYANWNLFAWGAENLEEQYEFDSNHVATIVIDGRANKSIGFKVRKSVGDDKWAEQEGDINLDLSRIVSGTIDVYTGNGSTNIQMGSDIVYENNITDIQLDYDKNVITIKTTEAVADPSTVFKFVKVDAEGNVAEVPDVQFTANGTAYTLSLPQGQLLALDTLYQYKIQFFGQKNPAYQDILYDIGIDTVYASKKFADEFTYTGNDLGATLDGSTTTFKVWAPTATAVKVALYTSGTKGTNDLIKTLTMTKGEKGVWTAVADENLNGTYYTYLVSVNGEDVEAVDPYARTTGVNGHRAMVIDLTSTNPSDWGNDRNPNPVTAQTDAIIYELHVRDFSIDDSSGMTNKGKYLAFTEHGTKTPGGKKTGIDYLDELGITHLHLLPVYDYASVDETKLNQAQFNWGYDPQNYNVPEGSYSTDPYNGAVRVKEFKQMVQALHDANISVVMDVVYNHVYDADTFSMNQIVPGYFSRVNSNVSGCGNDTASEREMVRKYIVDSVLYWHQEYHIDGFRFDLVGLLDVQTINEIVSAVHACCPDVIFYGEGWDMDGTNKEPGTEMAKQGNAYKTPGFAYFSDGMRNDLGGNNGHSTGFASGAIGKEGAIINHFLAKAGWTSNPNQIVQYASCHDNYTLVDKIILSTGRSSIDPTVIKMNNLAAAVYMTSQGVPFIHAGEEFLREKLYANGEREENSYNKGDAVNHIEWSNLDNAVYAANSAYYQGLIAFRKAHPALSLSSASQIQSNVYVQNAQDQLVSFWIDGRNISGESCDSIYVIFNANSSAKTVALPAGEWDVCINGTQAGTDVIKTVSGSVSVDGISAMVLVQAETTGDPTSSPVLAGSFNDWNQLNFMQLGDAENIVTSTVALGAGTYEFKIKIGNDWYGNSGTIADTTGAGGWDMSKAVGDNCKLQASGGYYTFTYNTQTNKLVVTCEPFDPSEYYLYGYINGVDYAMGYEPGDYKFDADGKLTITFTADSYVCVKNGDSTKKFMTQGWLGSVTSATMYNVADQSSTDGYDKLMIPGGVEVTITLIHNQDGTVNLSFETTTDESVVDTSGIQDGVTLHCWNWSFEEIEKNMAAIADMGFTAIQTSPVQPLKEATNLEGHSVSGNWWVYYQPVDFVITTAEGNALGTKAELKSMIETAHEYGIQVIVDVVANHLGNQTGNNLSDKIPEYLTKTAYWHDYSVNISNYKNRYDMTQHCMGGLPDLNTANDEIQGYVLAFLKECVDIGVDGFRFDAAKHIETPDDNASFASDFWPTVVGGAESYAQEQYGKDLYIYGELLDTWEMLPLSAYTKYMAITDNTWGNALRKNVVADNAALKAGYDKAVNPGLLVLWAESHDTYMTDDGNESSFNVSEADINKTWALVAARADAMGLYLARPESLTQALGVASKTGWDNPEVEAVNEFHNAFDGKVEVISNENGISYVERGTTGVVLVNVSSNSNTVSVTAHAMADGTYTDQITGNTFTVANGKISGEIGSTGIAVVYNVPKYDVEIGEVTVGTVEADKETAKAGETVTLTVTAAEGKEIESVTVTDASGASVTVSKQNDGTYTFQMPAANVTVAATFKDKAPEEPVKYNVTVPNGVAADKATAEAGQTVTLTVTVPEGKEIESVTVTDASGAAVTVTKQNDGTYTFQMPTSDVTVVLKLKDSGNAGGGEPGVPEPDNKVEAEESISGEVQVSNKNPETGAVVTITPKPDEGVRVEKVIVTDKNGNEITVTPNEDGTYSFTQPAGDVKVEVVFKTDYKIVTGNGSEVEHGSNESITVKANGAFRKFTGVKVDGKTVDPAHYTAKEGSTIITFKASFLQTLSAGEHVFTVAYTDDEVDGTFTLTEAGDEGEETTAPSTGDKDEETTAPSTGDEDEETTAPSAGDEDEETTAPSTGDEDGETTVPSTGDEDEETTAPSTGDGDDETTKPSAGNKDDEDTPPTGDESMIVLPTMAMTVSLLGLALLVLDKKRRFVK